MNEYERKRRGSFEEIAFPKITNDAEHQYSFMSGFESSNSLNSSPRDSAKGSGDVKNENGT